MYPGRELSVRQYSAGVAILGGHALLIFLLADATRHPRYVAKPITHDREVTFFLELPPPPEVLPEPEPKADPVRNARPRQPATTNNAITIDTPAGESPARAPTDWYGEANQLGRAAVGDALKHENRKCDPSDPPTTVLPKCRKPLPEYEWNRKEGRAGFVGPLPFVRLGKRCVVGLGFFGCGFGKEPPPNDQLYEQMKHPDRPTSSVPDVPKHKIGK